MQQTLKSDIKKFWVLKKRWPYTRISKLKEGVFRNSIHFKFTPTCIAGIKQQYRNGILFTYFFLLTLRSKSSVKGQCDSDKLASPAHWCACYSRSSTICTNTDFDRPTGG